MQPCNSADQRKQCDALKKLIPEAQRSRIDSLDARSRDTATVSNGNRNLADWVVELQDDNTSEEARCVTAIRDAEFAAFKLREQPKSTTTWNARVDVNIQDEGHSRSQDTRDILSLPKTGSGSKTKTKSISFADMEEDYTIPRQPGQLGCPFAMKPKQSAMRKEDSIPAIDLPTPCSSNPGSQMNEVHGHRPSFHDPLRPSLSDMQKLRDEESDEEDTGPACPIRFLDQHSPDEVAKYFEEHKHELPSSHAACVKRFQTSAESIKELDAKYGSLVTMIQGLGHKHQPMLPEAPQTSDIAVVDDTRSSKKIKRWAKAVSEGPHEEDVVADAADTETRARSEGVNDERLSHFDRPLKEIRVGESPSRPWGVPIPSKYLDQAADSEVGSGTSVAAVGPCEVKQQLIVKPQAAAVQQQSATKGKCPFGHGAPKDVPTVSQQQSNKTTAAMDNAPSVRFTPPSPASGHDGKEMPDSKIPTSKVQLVNHGLAFVAHRDALGDGTFENFGTLILGYDASEVNRIQAEDAAKRRL